MEGWIYSDAPNAQWTFLFFSVFLGALGGRATGRAFASTWRPLWAMPPALLALAAGVRFLHYALAGEDLLSPQYYCASLVIIAAAAFYSYRAFRVAQMTGQYPWLFTKSNALVWAAKASS